MSCLTGLNNLDSIGGSLNIIGNAAMTTFTGLDKMTSIGGGLTINYNQLLSSLTGIESLDYLGGGLYIKANNALTSLSGMENVNSIDGDFTINNNHSLNNLTGLDSVTLIGGDIYFRGNSALADLTGLNNLTSIGGSFDIIENDTLSSFFGLDALTSVGGQFLLSNNHSLTTLASLENLSSIGGKLFIGSNHALTSLEGLDNIDAGTIDNLYIAGNYSLSTCEVKSICEYLAAPGGNINIALNADGCMSRQEVREACSTCLPEGITFTTQTQIDSFQINFPNCTNILGSVRLEGDPPNDITNLNGLNVLTSIGGNLWIGSDMWPGGCIGLDLTSLSGLNNVTSIGGSFQLCGCSLSNLSGLESLTSVGGSIQIHDNWLSSLNGLENLDSIGYSLLIGEVTEYGDTHGNRGLQSISALGNLNYIGHNLLLAGNNSLSSFEGLENLNSIGGFLRIIENSDIASLAGLENIAATSIDSLTIVNNMQLNICDVQSICNYLANPIGSIRIENNASGCNSQQEVEEACASFVYELGALFGIKTQPNPFTSSTTLSYVLKQPSAVQLSVYNQLGQLIYQHSEDQQQGSQKLHWQTENQPEGIYFYQLHSGDQVANGKLVKVN